MKMFMEKKMVDERISRAIDNDHTAAMKATGDNRKYMRKKGGSSFSSADSIFVCMLCKKAFKNQIIYRKHMKMHADRTDKSYVCHLCGKSYAHKHYLQNHVQSHGSKHQYPCHLCHKRFSQKGNLNQHLKFHAATKTSFKCEICDKDFFQQEHLKTHLRHHTNERPFECEICQKSFNIKSSLQRHMNCHTGEKPFICDICNRGYTRRSVLMLHIQQVHENKKPFQCDECQLCFSQKGNLQAHFRRKHLQPNKLESSKRNKEKDGIPKMSKKGIKRQSSKGSKTFKICTNKNNYISSSHSLDDNNTAIHNYASKMKAIVNRNSKMFDNGQRTTINIKSELVSDSEESANEDDQPPNSRSSGYSGPNPSLTSTEKDSLDVSVEALYNSSSSGSSDNEVDIPDLNFPSILENQIIDAGGSVPLYDVKSLSCFETLLDENRDWDEYLMVGDSDALLNSVLPHYDLTDGLLSPVKMNNAVSNTKEITDDSNDGLFANISWTLGSYDTCPSLFSSDGIDDIKDIPSVSGGKNLANQSSPDGKKRKHHNSVTKKRKPVKFNIPKMHLASTSLQA